MKNRVVKLLFSFALFAVVICICIVANADGWVKEENHLCYYKNDVKYTGIKTIDGKVYSFTDEGFLKGNGKVQEAGGEYYFADENNILNYGWVIVQGKKYYFDTLNGKAYKGNSWGLQKQIDGIYYLFNNFGELVINDWWSNWDYVGPFFFGDHNGVVATGYRQVNGIYYFFDDKGESQNGWQLVGEYLHYFSPNHSRGVGYPEIRGWVKDPNDAQWYYCDNADGHRIINTTKTIDGHEYVFSETGALQITGNTIIVLENGIFAIDANGDTISGWQTINSDTYYFTYSGAATGVKEIDGDSYYFDADGKMQTNQLIRSKKYDWGTDEHLYYYGLDGKRVTGWKTIDEDRYYFDRYDGALTGTHNMDGAIYTFSDEGKLVETVIPVTGVTLEKADLTMNLRDSESLTATVIPDNATNKKVTWYSNDTNIVRVDSDGKVTAVGAGGTTVVAVTDYGNYTAYCHIVVEEGNLLLGDVNGDNIVDGRDAIRLMKYLAGEVDEETGEIYLTFITNADINRDGFVDELDLLSLIRYLSGEISSLQ